MRRFVGKGFPAAAAAIAIAATGTVGGGAVYMMMTAPRAGQTAQPARANGPATRVVPAAEQPAPLKRVVPPDFLAVAGQPVSRAKLRRVARLKHVRDVITVDAGAVQLQGGKVNMFAVDPSRFRSWTPPGTARDTRLWAALAKNQFVVSDDVQQQLGLRESMQYSVVGKAPLQVVMGGAGSLGLPGINVLVGRATGQKIGLVRDIALLVNAPGADLNVLNSSLRKLIGAQSQIINLHDKQNQLQQKNASRDGAGSYLDLYKQAAAACHGLSWTVLAAIGQIESSHGRNNGPSSAGALGPMQFMPATWKAYGVDGDDDGKADIMDPYDAVPTAAKYLCANGAGRGGASLSRAVWHYNHSQDYVNSVLSLAQAYARHYS